MTTWDKIYRNYQKTGEGYATLKKELLPEFLEFVKATDFKLKKALDVGFGNGKYLVYLENLGFEVAGIDSSPTALELARKSLGKNAGLKLADIYGYRFPSEKYDLILSIASIHHGRRAQTIRAIKGIHRSLVSGGYFFITLPDKVGSSHWINMAKHREIEPGTRIPLSGPEKGLPHCSFTKKELKKIFSIFSDIKMKLLADRGRWIISGRK